MEDTRYYYCGSSGYIPSSYRTGGNDMDTPPPVPPYAIGGISDSDSLDLSESPRPTLIVGSGRKTGASTLDERLIKLFSSPKTRKKKSKHKLGGGILELLQDDDAASGESSSSGELYIDSVTSSSDSELS